MMGATDLIRAHGCNLRATIINAHSNLGHKVGLRVLRRMAYEIGANGAEIHGREAAASILYEAADNVVRDVMPKDVDPEPTIVDLVDAPPVDHPAPPVPVDPVSWSWVSFAWGGTAVLILAALTGWSP